MHFISEKLEEYVVKHLLDVLSYRINALIAIPSREHLFTIYKLSEFLNEKLKLEPNKEIEKLNENIERELFEHLDHAEGDDKNNDDFAREKACLGVLVSMREPRKDWIDLDSI